MEAVNKREVEERLKLAQHPHAHPVSNAGEATPNTAGTEQVLVTELPPQVTGTPELEETTLNAE